MLEAPIPDDEDKRLELSRACRIMHTPSEEAFDDVARLLQSCVAPRSP